MDELLRADTDDEGDEGQAAAEEAPARDTFAKLVADHVVSPHEAQRVNAKFVLVTYAGLYEEEATNKQR